MQRPVVLGFAKGKVVGPIVRLERGDIRACGIVEESARDERAQMQIGGRRIGRRSRQILEQRLTLSRSDVGRGNLLQGVGKVRRVRLGAGQAEFDQDTPVRRIMSGDPRLELLFCYREIGRHRPRAGDDFLPLLVRSVSARAGRCHALDLPVDAAERLVHERVERALLVATHLVLV